MDNDIIIPNKEDENDGDLDLQNSVALQKITDYYLAGKHITLVFNELGQQVLLVLVSCSGASLYAILTDKYAHLHGSRLAGDTLLERQINYIMATCVISLAVLYNATDIFFTFRRNEIVPEQLQSYLVQTARKNIRKLHDIVIVAGAGISAIPLMLVSLAYPPQWITSLFAKIIFGAIIEIDNTILHFLPLKLALEYPIYRFPILPFEYLARKIYAKYYDVPTIPLQQTNVNTTAEIRRAELTHYIKQVQTQLLLDKSEWGFFVYHWHLSADLKRQMISNSATELMQVIAREFPFNEMITTERPKIQGRFAKLNDGLERISGILGGIWVIGSCAGYLLGPVQIDTLVENPVATAFIVAFPLYFFTVLLSFFGFNAGKQLYNMLTQWGEDVPKFPLEFKLYPKTFAILMYLNVYMAFYSYAAAEELVIDNFNEGFLVQMKPTLIIFARTGISFLGLTAMKDFYQIILRKYATYFGDETSRFVARLMTSLEQLEHAIQTISVEVLEHDDSRQFIENLKKGNHTVFSNVQNNIDTDASTERTSLLKPEQRGWGDWLAAKVPFWNLQPRVEENNTSVNESSKKSRCVIS